MVPLLEQCCYDSCGTTPPTAAEQKDILEGTQARVDESQLHGPYVCSFCNAHKGTDLAGLDPQTRKLTPLFNPRRHKWNRHFRWDGSILRGLTPIGRVTIAVLNINDHARVTFRAGLIELGVFPPSI